MTTGSINRTDALAKTVYELSWSGPDRPSVRYPKPVWKTVRREKAVLRYRLIDIDQVNKPTKREIDVPHNFNKSWNENYPGGVQSYTNNNNVTSNVRELSLGYTGAPGLITPLYSDHSSPDKGIFVNNDVTQMLQGLREKIYGSDFNLSVFLGEGHQTLELIADSATRVYNSLRHLKRGDVVGAAKSLVNGTTTGLRTHSMRRHATQTMSQNWLELQYGWMPLLGDTYGAATSLAHMTKAPFQTHYTVRKTREKVEWQTGGGSTPTDARYTYGFRTTQRVALTVIIRERPSSFYALGLKNPEIVAWELMPWSFVIDWFLPIGQYLDARAAASSIAGTWITSNKIHGVYLGVKGHLGSAGAYWRRGTFERIVSSTPPVVPLPNFKSLDKALSWKHCVNALALLTTAASGPRDAVSRRGW